MGFPGLVIKEVVVHGNTGDLWMTLVPLNGSHEINVAIDEKLVEKMIEEMQYQSRKSKALTPMAVCGQAFVSEAGGKETCDLPKGHKGPHAGWTGWMKR